MELPNYHSYPSYLVTFDQKWPYIEPYLQELAVINTKTILFQDWTAQIIIQEEPTDPKTKTHLKVSCIVKIPTDTKNKPPWIGQCRSLSRRSPPTRRPRPPPTTRSRPT